MGMGDGKESCPWGSGGEERKRREELSGWQQPHKQVICTELSSISRVCLNFNQTVYICSSGFLLGPEVFKKGALRTRLSASCTLMAGVWRAWIMGSKF